MTPLTPSNEVAVGNNDQQLLMAFLGQFSGMYSGSAIGSLAVIGVVSDKSLFIGLGSGMNGETPHSNLRLKK